jgi:hypothetical protein
VSPETTDIAVIHLVWAPLGTSMLEEFLAAYDKNPAGMEHRLVVILNGFEGDSDPRRIEIDRLLERVEHEPIVMAEPVSDLGAYREAAVRLDARTLCFLNSYSRPLVGDWLSLLAAPMSRPDVGMTGTGGSYESAYSAAPFWLRRRRRRDFDLFPNPHLRTNGFMLDREMLLDLDWATPQSKAAAWALESGKRSISRQVQERGLQTLVVGRNGVAYPPERWRESATFRSDGQRNLLVADNRTSQYEVADSAMKRRLEEMAWGPDADMTTPNT